MEEEVDAELKIGNEVKIIKAKIERKSLESEQGSAEQSKT